VRARSAIDLVHAAHRSLGQLLVVALERLGGRLQSLRQISEGRRLRAPHQRDRLPREEHLAEHQRDAPPISASASRCIRAGLADRDGEDRPDGRLRDNDALVVAATEWTIWRGMDA